MKPTTALAACAAAFGFALSALAVGKPLAVWNGDFPTSGTETRGGHVLSVNGNTVANDGTYIEIVSGSSGGVTVLTNDTSAAISPVGAVIGVSGVSAGEGARVLASSYAMSAASADSATTYANRTAVGLTTGGVLSLYNGTSGSPAVYGTASGAASWPGTGLQYFGFIYTPYGSTSWGKQGTYGYLNGSATEAVKNSGNALAWTADYVRGVSLGGWNGSADYNATGAKISYIALFRGVQDAETIAAWSLTGMTSAETLDSTATGFTGGDAVGVNFNGGTVAASGAQTAAALFVQASTELDVTLDNTLTVNGPVYVADDNTLTVKVKIDALPAAAGTTKVLGYSFKAGTVSATLDKTAVTLGDGDELTVTVADDGVYVAYVKGGVFTVAQGDTYIVAANDTLTANGGFVVDGDLIVYGSLSSSAATAVTGSGTVTYVGQAPNTTANGTTWWTNSDWTGTVAVGGKTGWGDINPNLYGNEKSKLQLSGVTGYFANPAVEATHSFTTEVVFEDGSYGFAFAPSNGYSYDSTHSTNFNVFARISGTGTLSNYVVSVNGVNLGYAQMMLVRDASAFTGSIRHVLADGTYTKNPILVFSEAGGPAAKEDGSYAYDSTYGNSTIQVLSDGTAVLGDGSIWQAAAPGSGAIHIAGSVEFKGTATWASAATLADGSQLTFDAVNGSGATLTAPSGLTVADGGVVTIAFKETSSEICDKIKAANGVLTLIDWSGTTPPVGASFAIKQVEGGYSFGLRSTSTGLVLTMSGIAKIGSTPYFSISDAITANAGNDITLLGSGAVYDEAFSLTHLVGLDIGNNTLNAGVLNLSSTLYLKGTGTMNVSSLTGDYGIEFQGATTLNLTLSGGTTTVDSIGSDGNATSSVNISGNGLLQVNGACKINGDLTFTPQNSITPAQKANGNSKINIVNVSNNGTATLKLTAGSVTVGGALNGSATIETTSGVTVNGGGTFHGTIAGAGGLVAADGLTLYGPNTFTGGLNVSGGTMALVSSLDGISPFFRLDASVEDSIKQNEEGNVTNWASQVNNYSFTNEASAMVVSTEYFGGKPAVVTAQDTLRSTYNEGTDRHAQCFFGAIRLVSAPNDKSGAMLFAQQNGSNWFIGRRNSGSDANTKKWTKMEGSSSEDDTGVWLNGAYNARSFTTSSEQTLSVVDFTRTGVYVPEVLGGGAASVAIAELIALGSNPDIETIKRIETYLADKWDIAGAARSLPTNGVVTVETGATLDLGGTAQYATGLTLNGTLANGTLTVKGNAAFGAGAVIDIGDADIASWSMAVTGDVTGLGNVSFAANGTPLGGWRAKFRDGRLYAAKEGFFIHVR